MKTDFLKCTAAASLALALMAAPAAAQGAYGDWDADTSGSITSEEWNTGWANYGLTGDIDQNDDRMLDRTEFEQAIGDEAGFNERYGETAFDDWDANDDDMLSDEELGTGMYTAYDADASGDLNEEEFATFGDDAGEDGLFDI